jgi:small GTP-binding protein
MNTANLYLTASSRQKGALALFHAYGEEGLLARVLDTKVAGSQLFPHDLRYGWLRDESGETIDEVMLAAPVVGRRILMTHGGKVIRDQAESYFERSGFAPISINSKEILRLGDPLLAPLLTACVTESQAAAVLAARESGDMSKVSQALAQHRVVLAGPPNAGKSSLLNALAGSDRAFVDPEAGATRDVVDELIDLAGYAVWLGDMPGYMNAKTVLDTETWEKAAQRLRLAEEVWFVVDASEEWSAQAEYAAQAVRELVGREGEKPVLVILNKTDCPVRLTGDPWRKHFPAAPAVSLNTLADGNAVEVLEEYVAEVWRFGI